MALFFGLMVPTLSDRTSHKQPLSATGRDAVCMASSNSTDPRLSKVLLGAVRWTVWTRRGIMGEFRIGNLELGI